MAIIEAKIVFDSSFKQTKADINVYTPNAISDKIPDKVDKYGNPVPVLIARMNSDYDNYLYQKVDTRITEIYKQSVKYALTYDILKSKKDYLKARLGWGSL